MMGFSAKNIIAGYGSRPVIDDLTFRLENGRLMGLLGANGSGKTTLLKSICGILRHEGECVLEGTPLENLNPKQMAKMCSYIPQRSGIAIDISALDVVLMGFNPRLGLLERPGNAMKKSAMEALCQVGLAGYEEVNYMHLSEGQKQLCILARTLVSDGRMLLLDEPESALDFRFRYRMLEIIREWVRSGDRFGIVALHDPMLALNYCDDLMLLKDGRNIGILRTKEDSPEKMEKMLTEIYGRICLTVCTDRQGRQHIVMLKEQEECL